MLHTQYCKFLLADINFNREYKCWKPENHGVNTKCYNPKVRSHAESCLSHVVNELLI